MKRQFDRRVAVRIGESTVHVYAPEDIIVRKLRWSRLRGETSERQWRDVAGILRITGERIDFGYLEHAAYHFGVDDLLRRARDDAKW